jgi:hypothetical protein
MTWLTSLPAIVLVGGWLAVMVAVAALSRWLVRVVVPATEGDQVPGIAAPLMPALGAAFAVLMALTLASEAGYLRSAQDLVSNEAAQASRLAWTATSPAVDSAGIQTALTVYLTATRANEWRDVGVAEDSDPATSAALAGLERVTRTEAARPEVGAPAANALLGSLDALTTARRARLAAATRELPALYVLTLLVSGVALVVNGGALTFRSSLRTSSLVLGLAAVVGLSMALLFALSGPWTGEVQVSGQPIDTVLRDLRAGFFSLGVP